MGSEGECLPQARSMAGNGIYQGFAGLVGQGLFVFSGDCCLPHHSNDIEFEGLCLPVACIHIFRWGMLLCSGAVALGAALEHAMRDQ